MTFTTLPTTLKAGLVMILAMGAFTAGDTMTKLMAGEVPVGQIVFFRGVVATAIITAVCWQQKVLSHVPLVFQKTVLARTFSDVTGTLLFITALMHMPIANLTAVMQAVPLVVIAFAALILGERVGLRRTLAIAIGLLGVGLIVKPAPATFTFYDGLSLGLVAAIAIRDIFTRRLTVQVPTMIVVLSNAVFVMLSGLPLALFEDWVALQPRHLVLLASGGILLSIGYVFMVLTIRMGDISATAIYRYSVVLFALIAGIFVFDEIPDGWALLGIGLIVASGSYALMREMRLARIGGQP